MLRDAFYDRFPLQVRGTPDTLRVGHTSKRLKPEVGRFDASLISDSAPKRRLHTNSQTHEEQCFPPLGELY